MVSSKIISAFIEVLQIANKLPAKSPEPVIVSVVNGEELATVKLPPPLNEGDPDPEIIVLTLIVEKQELLSIMEGIPLFVVNKKSSLPGLPAAVKINVIQFIGELKLRM